MYPPAVSLIKKNTRKFHMGSNQGPYAYEANLKITTQENSANAENGILRICGHYRMKGLSKTHLCKMFFEVRFSGKRAQKLTHHKRTSYLLATLFIPFDDLFSSWLVHSNRLSDFLSRTVTRVRLLDHVLCSNVEYLVKTLTHSRVGGRVCARYHSSRTLSRTSSTATTLLCS